MALHRNTASVSAANPDLVGKTYTFDEVSSTGGGLYLWRDAKQRRIGTVRSSAP